MTFNYITILDTDINDTIEFPLPEWMQGDDWREYFAIVPMGPPSGEIFRLTLVRFDDIKLNSETDVQFI